MADYNAHTYYGKKCLEYLGPERSSWLVSDETAFQLGLYGPDPLKFTGVGWWKVLCYHQDWRDEVLPWISESIRSEDPTARAYAVGCLLHFLLDEKTHEPIERWAREGSSHLRLELALDALVLKAQEITRMPRICVRHRSSIHHVFPGVEPSLYRLGLRVMAKVADVFRWRGDKLCKKVTQKEWDQARCLMNLLEEHVAEGAKALEELLPERASQQ